MLSPEVRTALQLLLFDPLLAYQKPLLETLQDAAQIESAVTTGDFETALYASRWNAVLIVYTSDESLKLAELAAPQAPVIFLCETPAEAETIIELTTPIIADVVIHEQLKRLPFILRREVSHITQSNTNQQIDIAASLARSELRFRYVIEGFNDLILFVDQYQFIRYANWDALTRNLGFQPSDVISKPLAALLHADEKMLVEEKLTTLLQTINSRQSFECQVRRVDGVWETVEMTGHSMSDPAGQPTLTLHIRIVSQQKRAIEKIHSLNRTLALLSDINQAIVRTRDVQTLFDEACNIAVEKGAFRMAWIGLLDPQTQAANPVAQAGVVEDYLDSALKAGPVNYGPTAIALKTRKHVVMNDIEHDPIMQRLPWRDNALRLGYRASVVLPLVVKGESRAVYHLYSDTVGFFDDQELKLLDELSGDLSFAMEFAEQEAQHKQAEEQVKRLYRTLNVLSDVNQAIVRTRNMQTLFTEACKIAVEKGTFRMAWIGLLDPQTRKVMPVGHAGITEDYLDKLNISLDDEVRGRGPTGTALRSGQRVVINDVQTNPLMLPWRTDALRLGYNSTAALPLIINGEARGLIALYADEVGFFDDQELKLLDEMASDLAFAMEFAEKEELRQRGEIALQRYAKRMSILHQIDSELLKGGSIQALIRTTLKHLRQIIPCQAANVTMIDHETHEGQIFALDFSNDNDTFFTEGVRFPLPADVFDGYDARGVRLFDDIRSLQESSPRVKQLVDEGMVSLLSVFLIHQDKPIGSLVLVANAAHFFNAEYQEIAVDLANQLAIAIRQMQLSDQIRQSEGQYRLLAENMADVIWMLDAVTGRFTYVSPSVQQLRGYTPQEVLTQTLAEALTPASLEMITDTLPERIEAYVAGDPTAISQTHEVEQPRKDGSTVWTEVVTTLLKDDNNAIGVLGVTRDITDRKRAEAELHEREEWIRLSMEASDLGKWRFDIQTGILRFDERARIHYGFDHNTVPVTEVLAHIHPDDIERFQRELAASTDPSGNPKAAMEYRVIDSDGSERWLSALSHIYFEGHADERRPVYGFGTSQDITGRKQAEESLRRSEERYRSLINSSEASISMVDNDGRYLFLNAIAATPFKVPPSDLIGKTVHDLFIPQQANQIVADVRKVIEQSEGLILEPEVVINGEKCWFRTSIQPVRDGSGKAYAALIYSTETTEQKQAQLALIKSESRQRAMLSAIPDLMFRYSADGTFLEYHAPDSDLLAVSPEMFLGKKATDLFPPELSEQVLEQIKQVITTKEPVSSEYKLNVPSGLRDFESRLVPVGEDKVLSIVRDVTERKLAERELQSLYNATSYLFKADSLLALGRQIVAAVVREFEHADCGLMLLDKSKNNILRLARTGQSDIRPDTPLSLSGKGLVPLAMRTGEVIYVSDVTQNNDYIANEATTQSEFVIPLKTSNGIVGALDMQRPQTNAFSERDRRILTAYAERAAPAIEIMQLYEELNRHAADLEWRVAQRTVELNYAKERAEAILNHSADGIILLSSKMAVEQTNSAFNEIFTAWEDAYFEQPLTELLIDEEKERINNILQEVSIDKKGLRIETHARRKDGSVFDAELGIGVIKKSGYVCIIRDISERKRAEKAIAEERNLLRTLIDSLPDYIYVKDTNHKTLLSNLARAHSFGLESAEETIGKDDYAYVPADMAAKFHADEDRLFKTLEPLIDLEEHTIGPKGDVIWAATTKVPLHNLNGELIGLVGVTRDISERKLREQQLRFSEEQLRESQKMLQLVLDTIPVRVFWKDRNSVLLGCNRLFAQDAGFENVQDLLTKPPDEMKTIASEEDTFRADEISIMETGIPKLDYEETLTPQGQEKLNIQTSKLPLRNDRGDVIGIIGVYSDITIRKKAEQALSQSEQLLRTVLNMLPVGVWILDKAGTITYGNPAVQQIWSGAQYVGVEKYGVFKAWWADTGKPIEPHEWGAARAIATGETSLNEEVEIESFDQTHKIILNSAIPLRDDEGEIIGGVVLNQDITERKKAEQTLRESETRFRSLFASAPIATIITNQIGQITLINEQAGHVFGYSTDELIGQPVEMLIPASARNAHPDHRADYIAEPRVRRMSALKELNALRKDGTEFPAEIELSYVNTRDGLLVMSFVMDITERKKAEQALRESEMRFGLLVNGVRDYAIYLIDARGNIVTWNQGAERIKGYTAQEIIGDNIARFYTPEDVARGEPERTLKFAETEGHFTTEGQRVRKDGSVFWAEVAVTALKDSTGRLFGYAKVTHDLTERRKAQETLRLSEERYRLLAENITDIISRVSPDGVYIDVSSSSKHVLGYTSEEMIGKHGADFIHPDDRVALLQKRENASRERNETPLTCRFRHRDGHYLWLEVARKYILSPETNTIKEYVTSSRDITIRKRAEEALKNALEKEKELGELKSRFVSMASHEFRTPLATILATAETLSAYRSKLSENQIKEKLDKIGDQVTYLKSIIEDTLQVARLQDPKAKYEPVSLDLDAVCRSAIDEFESRPEVTQRFVYTCDAELRQVWLDRKLIRQMMSNLLSNAVKYSAANSTITVTLEYSEEALTLNVQDEGIGIPEADLKHLFEPFHRAINVGTIPGTGLGLVIAKESVELHGGLMTVESKVGVGTTFTIIIPFGVAGGHQHDENSAD